MSWFGKMLGGTIGLMIGGPLGAIAGGAIGHHLFDKKTTGRAGASEWYGGRGPGGRGPGGPRGYARSQTGGPHVERDTDHRRSTNRAASQQDDVEQKQAAFFLALFSILGKLAKADGTITKEEGQAVVSFLDRMNVHGDQRQFAIRVFNEAKNSRYSVEDFARQFSQMTSSQHDLRSSMLDMLFQIALADGEFHAREEEMIRSVAGILGIADAEYDALRTRYVGDAEQAYSVLGLTKDASDDEVKDAYRRLVHEYHPDRIISQGMPQEFVEYATQRFQEIQTAWDHIKNERNL